LQVHDAFQSASQAKDICAWMVEGLQQLTTRLVSDDNKTRAAGSVHRQAKC